MIKKLRQLRDRVLRDLWRDIPTPSRVKSLLLQTARVFVLAGRNFVLDRCLMRATSLAFVTLLSFVPLLAFTFSVLKGFEVGGETLKPWLIRQVVGTQAQGEDDGAAPGAQEGTSEEVNPEAQAAKGQKQLVEGILHAIERTDVRALGTIGLLFLLWTTIKLLSTIEVTFNHIWNVTRSRTFLRKLTDYVSVLVIAPILLFVAMSLTAAFQSTAFVAQMREGALIGPVAALLLSWLRYVGTWIAFSAIYLFMPNTRVRLRAAILGGVVAGTAWQLAFWAYAYFQIGVAKYGAIYTTFAAIPVFMMWLYLSWTIVLFGAEVAYAMENVGRFWEERRAEGASFAVLEAIALRTMVSVSAAFYRGGHSLTIEEIAERCKAPGRLVSEVLQRLVKWGVCAEIVGEEGAAAYQPGRALEKITPADVLAALRHYGEPLTLSTGDPEATLATELLAACDITRAADLTKTSFRDIAARLAPDAAADSPS